MKYIDAEKLKAHIEAKMEILWNKLPDADKEHPTDIELRDLGMYMALEGLIDDLDSLQQEPTPDTDVLHTELVNLLKTYRIGEETARTMADRIADTYGAQKYMDGLCDGLDEEDTKQEKPEVDLEKIIGQTYHDGSVADTSDMDLVDYENIACHFYELGLNARKV